MISANLWGIRLDGQTATLNLIEGNNVGTDLSGTAALGNEINGIILSDNASNNTDRRHRKRTSEHHRL